ncbi:hypothetical protein [Streptomyces sp. Tu 3180]|uniref:hypothetical protein n=1 Tax=Streptomyces sp. Tu 3180 TaxID=2682611 RepID=UPI00135751CA|nr:hypothetical protein [Streptomyces sp. Tu 3180]KAF3467846.1 hypothetical protein GL259_28465 [Streptomyces sp. Tu 3180]
MGVFAWLFRRSKATEETRTDGARADGAAAGPKTEEDAAGAAEPTVPADAPKASGPAAEETGEVTRGDGVEIPKQQSSEAADSEAGGGART